MNKLSRQLFNLGYEQPELRPHLRPILATLDRTGSNREVQRLIADAEDAKDRGDHRQAEAMLSEALRLAENTGSPQVLRMVHRARGRILNASSSTHYSPRKGKLAAYGDIDVSEAKRIYRKELQLIEETFPGKRLDMEVVSEIDLTFNVFVREELSVLAQEKLEDELSRMSGDSVEVYSERGTTEISFLLYSGLDHF